MKRFKAAGADKRAAKDARRKAAAEANAKLAAAAQKKYPGNPENIKGDPIDISIVFLD